MTGHRDVVAVGASAGGVEALRALEKSALTRRMAGTDRPYHSSTTDRFRHMADDAEAAGSVLRGLIDRIGAAAPDPAPDMR